jgi:hypothetical protein
VDTDERNAGGFYRVEEEKGWLNEGHPSESNVLQEHGQTAYLKRDSAGTAGGFFLPLARPLRGVNDV